MHPPRPAPSPADVGAEVMSLSAVLGVVTLAIAPFALPGLLLALVLVAPLALLAVPALLLAGLVALPLRLIRIVRRGRPHPPRDGGGDSLAGPAHQHAAAGQGAAGGVRVAG
jgi:hypothetical protein